MSSAFKPEDLARLNAFIDTCNQNPEILHIPQLAFFRNYIESLGGKIPPPCKENTESSNSKEEAPQTNTAESTKMEESESEESDLELDNAGVIEPETEPLPELTIIPVDAEVSEEDLDKSNEKRSEAMASMSEGNWSAAVDSFTEAIKLNPSSAALYAKRAGALIKQNRVKAAIQDCDQAIKINPDSAVGHKLRGRGYRLLGQWVEAARDLRLACTLDCDEQAMDWLREVQPNATKLEERDRKRVRRVEEREAAARRERVRKVQEAQEQARKKAAEEARHSHGMGGMGGMGDMGGMFGGPGGMPGAGGPGGMPDLSGLMNDPELMQAFTDPEISAAFSDVSSNPANIFKYKDNPKVANVINKMMKKFGGGGDMGGFPGFGEDAPPTGGKGGSAPPPPPSSGGAAGDDDLD